MTTYKKYKASERGTKMHAVAKDLIELGHKQINNKNTFNAYINDAIGFKMDTEVVLYYSDNCFGTADAISFKKNFLRIHDLKTGVSPASMNQLLIYAGIFCLEYKIKPHEIQIELRIYQSDEIEIHIPEPEQVYNIMGRIIACDKRIEELKIGG